MKTPPRSELHALVARLRRLATAVWIDTEDDPATDVSDGLTTAADALSDLLKRDTTIRMLVTRQADDDGLWFSAQTAAEAYLQQEMRRLHAVIEGDVTA
jgi:hypothetical protein